MCKKTVVLLDRYMIPSTPTLYLILVGFIVLMIVLYGNYVDIQASEASLGGSTGNNTLEDRTIPNNIASNKTNGASGNSTQKDFLFSDKFEVINKTSENGTMFREGFDRRIKIIQFGPTVNDPNLSIETVFKGINFPTSMVFVGNDDILVLEKNTGKVRRIINWSMLDQPLLDVHVGNKNERGLLGIAITKQKHENSTLPSSRIFLYYTETKSRDGEDLNASLVVGNRLYKYEFENNALINPKLLLDLPGEPGGDHQGGVILVGPDNNIYLSVGDVNHFTQAQNNINGSEVDGTGGILRITADGEAIQGSGILGREGILSKYYAYGIRNSYGIDFDPVTSYLWDTENGVNCCDEINLVEPGFNSGWKKIQGISGVNQSDDRIQTGIFDESLVNRTLFDFNGKGKYSHPEFVWNYTVGPTALKFFNSTNLGEQYENDMFIGDVNTQSLYRFDLSKDRKELQIPEKLSNKIAQTGKDLEAIQFAKDFGRITDIDLGPDGNLYVLSHKWNNANQSEGSIFRISKSVSLGKNFTHENVGWINYDENVLSISTETDSPLSSNGSLKVDILEAMNVAIAVNSSWSIVSTDFIPLEGNQYYNYGLEVSAKNTNQLHSKVIYYDSNKNEINSDFIFGGRDGTFEDKIGNSFLAPNGTKYVQIQFWVRPTLDKSASYIVDNVEIQSLVRGWVDWTNYDENVLSISTETDSPLSGNGSMKVNVKPALSTADAVNSSWSIVSTDFIQAEANQYYNYSLEVTAKDVNQLHSKVIYYDSNKNEINSDFIFGGRDGTFEDKIGNSFLAPNGTKYVQIQFWVRPTFEKSASYVVDTVEVSLTKF